MVSEEMFVELNNLKVLPEKPVRLENFATDYQGKKLNKKEGEDLLEDGREHLAEIQEKLYAHNRYGVLIILQAMDAAGKDGAIKHILSGMSPVGVKIHNFKAPTAHELDHDYFWRHSVNLPPRGEIAIHNRSHYENVLVTRVHPEYILKENIPGIDSVDKITPAFWMRRFEQIKRYEQNIAENGTIILKFFLHVSKDEQKKRLLQRIDEQEKHWKFDVNDLRERACWDEYQRSYEEAINSTSTGYAPWFIIPADNKWYARLAIASVIYRHLTSLDIQFPTVSAEQREALLKARDQLMNE
jgi:PPK2 family polyphosphate:nucleotide phosphotransferase